VVVMFASEAELVAQLQQSLRSLDLGGLPLAWAQELPVNGKVVDLVLCPLREDALAVFDNWGRAFSRLSLAEIATLSVFLPTGAVSIHCLSKRTFMPPRQLHERFLSVFLRVGLIRRVSQYRYEATEWREAICPEFVAIEAKIHKWCEALMQARNNLAFAQYSYVALDWTTAKRIRAMMEAEGVGLVAVSPVHDTQIMASAKRIGKPRHESYVQAIRMLRDLTTNCKRKRRWQILKGDLECQGLSSPLSVQTK